MMDGSGGRAKQVPDLKGAGCGLQGLQSSPKHALHAFGAARWAATKHDTIGVLT